MMMIDIEVGNDSRSNEAVSASCINPARNDFDVTRFLSTFLFTFLLAFLVELLLAFLVELLLPFP